MAVDDVALSLATGETLALVGESGCGKTLLALAIVQLLPTAAHIVSGEVRVNGVDVVGLSPDRLRTIRGRQVAYISQEPHSALNPVMKIGDQIEEVLAREAVNKSERRGRVLRVLEDVGIPDPAGRMQAYPHQLSGGMKQRVAIAMALAAEPEILIADEPTTALDVTTQAQILTLLSGLQKKTGLSVVFITHDLGVVRQTADRVAVMYCGQIVETASVDALLSEPSHPYTQALLAALPNQTDRGNALETIPGSVAPLVERPQGCQFQDRCDYVWDDCRTDRPELVSYRPDHQIRCHLYQQVPLLVPRKSAALNGPQGLFEGRGREAESVLRVEKLSVRFQSRRKWFAREAKALAAVADVSFDLRAASTVAIVGESGCGKSTLAKAIMGLIPANAGQVKHAGSVEPDHPAFRRDVQMIFQDAYASLNPRMTVEKIIAEGMVAQNVRLRVSLSQRIRTLIEQVGLSEDVLRRYPSQLSGGQRQRVCIARALAVEPKVLICDEPTSALDVSVQAQILNLLTELQDSLSLTLLVITHDLSVVSYLADEILVMYLGRVVERGPGQQVLRSPKHPYTKMLLASAPDVTRRLENEDQVRGELPSPVDIPVGCSFRTRCPVAFERCGEERPELRDDARHAAACFHVGQVPEDRLEMAAQET